MFNKILIANRGEIAARIIRTCKGLNIPSVAIYSDADEQSPYVRMADEAHGIGGTRVHESYLNMDKIIQTAKDTGAEAVHPGYGLLSENPEFARRCNEEGLTFIGPSPSAIEKMGSKIEARKTMKAAGVPVIPGTEAPVSSSDEAIQMANEIGYPVMLKASAGGGGIGMQVVYNDDELQKAFESNSRRAQNFFGDGTMYLEKKIENAHHVEIQILADQHGNVIHLFERECSIQRRHQKVIEEAPSPLLTEETREKMGEAAKRAAKAIQYSNAGTIEFLVDEDQNFYFLEMNTRLQVEHPVTEEITGVDLVEQQIKIAAGEKLSIKQDDLQINGHAIEARVYAEDPTTFFPSPGTISALSLPEGEKIRHEMGVEKGYTVTPFYDPMIAKLIVTGHNREEAINVLEHALKDYHVEGIKTNLPFVQQVVQSEAFKKGITRTSFVDDYVKQTK